MEGAAAGLHRPPRGQEQRVWGAPCREGCVGDAALFSPGGDDGSGSEVRVALFRPGTYPW